MVQYSQPTTWVLVSYLELVVDLCCWQIWHSAAPIARLVLIFGRIYCWTHEWHHLWPWPRFSWNHCSKIGMTRKRGCPQTSLMYLFPEVFLSWSHLLISIYMGHRYLNILHPSQKIYPQNARISLSFSSEWQASCKRSWVQPFPCPSPASGESVGRKWGVVFLPVLENHWEKPREVGGTHWTLNPI